jgi:hypothetical protein
MRPTLFYSGAARPRQLTAVRVVCCLIGLLLISIVNAAKLGRMVKIRQADGFFAPLHAASSLMGDATHTPTQLQRLKHRVMRWGRLTETIGDEVLYNPFFKNLPLHLNII